MPMLILAVLKDLHELLQNCSLTSMTSLSESGGVVVMTVDLSFVLVVAIARTKGGRAYGA